MKVSYKGHIRKFRINFNKVGRGHTRAKGTHSQEPMGLHIRFGIRQVGI